jgi:hypothetical protein
MMMINKPLELGTLYIYGVETWNTCLYIPQNNKSGGDVRIWGDVR